MSGEDDGVTFGAQTLLTEDNSEKKQRENEANIKNVTHSPFEQYPKNIHEGKQGKHIPGHNNYNPALKKSYITISIEKLQNIVYSHSGKGQYVSGNKERIHVNVNIGMYIDPKTNKALPTKNAIIHYSKTGVHVVPASPYKK